MKGGREGVGNPNDAKTKVVKPRIDTGNGSDRKSAKELVGTTMGDYEVLELLGTGGMGSVYKAKKVSLDRTVALKILKPGLDADSAARFVREARLAAQLDHGNVVTIFHVGEVDGTSFIEMQYVRGRSVHELIASGRPLSLREAVRIVRQAAEGMAAAHELGIVHRDVKPSNIIIDENDTVKVADFGLAKRLDPETSLTMPEVLVGTPEYMAPEQWEDGSADIRTDIYSLGVTAYYLITGRKPFSGHTPATLMRQHLDGAFAPVPELNPDVPKSLSDVIHSMIARDPKTRYQSARALAEDLRQLEESGALATGETSVIRRDDRETPVTRRPSPQKTVNTGRQWVPMAVAAAVLAVVALLALVGPDTGKRSDVGFGGAGSTLGSFDEAYRERSRRGEAMAAVVSPVPAELAEKLKGLKAGDPLRRLVEAHVNAIKGNDDAARQALREAVAGGAAIAPVGEDSAELRQQIELALATSELGKEVVGLLRQSVKDAKKEADRKRVDKLLDDLGKIVAARGPDKAAKAGTAAATTPAVAIEFVDKETMEASVRRRVIDLESRLNRDLQARGIAVVARDPGMLVGILNEHKMSGLKLTDDAHSVEIGKLYAAMLTCNVAASPEGDALRLAVTMGSTKTSEQTSFQESLGLEDDIDAVSKKVAEKIAAVVRKEYPKE